MRHILISGLVNTETTVQIRQFPIPYFPIDYPFFGVDTAVSGVAYNIAGALHTLGDQVTVLSMTADDLPANLIRQELQSLGLDTTGIIPCLRQTPNSVVLYDSAGNRQIYCDLKDIQEAAYPFDRRVLENADLVAACNINFNRPLLPLAKAAGIPIATDVHVLTDPRDDYNRDFLECADLLFLSDEGIPGDYRTFLTELARLYGCTVIVLGRGSQGAAIYLRQTGEIYELPAVHTGPVVNTAGAGDALFSAFVHYYAGGVPPLEALARAQVFASVKIGVSGAAKGFVDETTVEALYRAAAGR